VAINAAILFFITRYGKQDELSGSETQQAASKKQSIDGGRGGGPGRISCLREAPSRRTSWAITQNQGVFGTATTHSVAFEGITIDRIQECTVDVEKDFEKDDSESEGPQTPTIPANVSRSFGSISIAERQAIAPFSDSLETSSSASNSESTSSGFGHQSSSSPSSRRGSSLDP
jgi:hypothetical protein